LEDEDYLSGNPGKTLRVFVNAEVPSSNPTMEFVDLSLSPGTPPKKTYKTISRTRKMPKWIAIKYDGQKVRIVENSVIRRLEL